MLLKQDVNVYFAYAKNQDNIVEEQVVVKLREYFVNNTEIIV